MLNSLEIKNFRSLEDFKVAKLGRVNLIVGKNNSGKSTVLEALRIYAGNARLGLLKNIAAEHDEKCQLDGREGLESQSSMPFEDFFTGRRFPDDETSIVIGESGNSEQALHIQHVFLEEAVETARDEDGLIFRHRSCDIIPLLSNLTDKPFFEAFLVKKGYQSFLIEFETDDIQRLFNAASERIAGMTPCSIIPTQLVSIDELAKEWDKIVGTEHEEVIRQAMRIILPEFENIYFVLNDKSSSMVGSQRTAKVKLPNLPRPVPLKSLGDGMIRVLQLALKLVSAKGGFLLIDEFENGLHYTVQEKIWELLFKMADELDVQVFATTHSRDCIESFTKVALDNEKTEGVLFRMGRSAKKSNQGQIIATVFDKERLYNITQADIEIR